MTRSAVSAWFAMPIQGIQCVAPRYPAGQQVVQRTLPALERRLDDAIATKPTVIDFALSQPAND